VKDVTGTGGVDYRDLPCRAVVEVLAVPCEDAVGAEGGSGEAATVAALHAAQGFVEVVLSHQAQRKIAAHDQVIDVLDEIFDAGIDIVEIGDNRDVGDAGPVGGEGGCGRVEAVDVKSAGVHDPIAIEVGGLKSKAFIAPAEHGALAICVNQDEGLRTERAGDGDKLSFNAGAREGVAMKAGGVIVAQLADVAGAETPGLAGDDGGGYLAAGQDGRVSVFGFGAADRVAGERDEGISGVEAYADEIDFQGVRHFDIVRAQGAC